MNILEQTEYMQFSFDITQSIKDRATSMLQSYSYDIFQITYMQTCIAIKYGSFKYMVELA